MATACTYYIHRMLVLSAFSILKILKSDLSQGLDKKAGERAYFKVIVFLREMSLENGDTSSKGAGILTQLWASNNIFRRADGTMDSLSLRIRSRLSLSVVFDCFWWWRQEFNGQPSPYDDSGTLCDRGENEQVLCHGPIAL
jgi:transcriptional regulatory protein LEU3